jgi:hypothetical protein
MSSFLGTDFAYRDSIDELIKANAALRKALEAIRETAYSPAGDDYIWMDDRTPLGQFIDSVLCNT